MRFTRKSLLAAAVIATTLTSTPAMAGSSTGTISVHLNVLSACLVNGAASGGAFGAGGDIAFTDQPGTFAQADAQVVGSLGDLSIQCSPGTTPTLTIGSGQNDSGGTRRMASGATRINYRLYTDAARSQEVGIGQTLSLGTMGATAVTMPLYARATNSSVLPAGLYSDTVQVTLAW